MKSLLLSRRSKILLCIVCLGISLPAHAAMGVLTLEQAEVLASDARAIPPDNSAWLPVTLPDNWHRTRPGWQGALWYRVRFPLALQANRNYAYSLPFARSAALEFYLNGALVGRTGEGATAPGSGAAVAPVIQPLSPSLLRDGENVFHVRATGFAQNRAGLPRLSVGEAGAVRQALEPRLVMSWLTYILGATVGLAGLLAFGLWRVRRRDPALGWFTFTALAWSALALTQILTRWVDLGVARELLFFLLNQGLAAPIAILSLRVMQRRIVWLERAIWIFYLVAVPAMLLLDRAWVTELRLVYNMANAALMTGMLGLAVATRSRPRPFSLWILVAALSWNIGVNLYDLARWHGLIDIDRPILSFLQLPGMLLVFCALVVQRHMFVVRSTDELNRDLERRVAEKTRAIEIHHEQQRTVEREQLIVRERGRILADMHDGLGASLVGLRRLIQSGRADQYELETRVDEALQEMRIAIDALEPVDGDIAAVLGNLRQRLQPTLERAGLQVVWQVGDLAPIENLTPAAIFAVQRALLEAFTNILKHADARTVTLSVQTDPAQQGVVITLSDDGKGFVPGVRGRGLNNIEQRIRAIGATAQIESVIGTGTRVTLHLPWQLPLELVTSPLALVAG